MLTHLYQSPIRNSLVLRLLFVLGISIMLSSCSSNKKPPEIEVEPQLQELGEIPQAPIELTYMITNGGGSNLTISKILTSCGCTEAEVDRDTIPAGESTTLRVTLDPAEDNLYGNVVRVIYISSNDPDDPEVEVEFRVSILEPVTTSSLDPEPTEENDVEEVAE